jgi:hypothetical protein
MPPRDPLLGAPAPVLSPEGATTPGGATTSDGATTAPDGLVVFLTSSCLACREIWAALGAAAPLPGSPPVTIVTPDPTLEDRRAVAALTPPGHLVLMRSAVWHAYRVTGSPWVVLVRDGTVVAEGPAAGWADLVATAGVR